MPYAAVDNISTGEKFEEIQFLGVTTSADACSAALEGHLVLKPGVVNDVPVMCIQTTTVPVWQYFPLSGIPQTDGIFDLGRTDRQWNNIFWKTSLTGSTSSALVVQAATVRANLTWQTMIQSAFSGAGGMASDFTPNTETRDLGHSVADTTPGGDSNFRWQTLNVIDIIFSGTISGPTGIGFPCLDDGTSTLCLTTPSSNQLLTGDTGNITIAPASGMVLQSNEAQSSTAVAFRYEDTGGNGDPNTDRTDGYYFKYFNRTVLDFPGISNSGREYALALSGEAVPKLQIQRPGTNNSGGFITGGGFEFGCSVNSTTGDMTSNNGDFRLRVTGTEARFSAHNGTTEMIFFSDPSDSGSLQFSLQGTAKADQQVLFEKASTDTVGTTVAPFKFKHPAFTGSQNYMEADVASLNRYRWNQLLQPAWADTSDPNFDVTLQFTSATAITADKTLTIDVSNGDRTLDLQSDVALNQNLLTTSDVTFSTTTVSGGQSVDVETVTATSATLGSDDYVILVDDDTAGSTVTITLPAASSNGGRVYHIKKLGTTANVIVDGNGSETIDLALTVTLTAQGESISIVSDASNWHIY